MRPTFAMMGVCVSAAAWGQLLIPCAIVAGLPAIYALRPRATLFGMITLAVVVYGLYALWLMGLATLALRAYEAIGEPAGSIWPTVAVLVGMAVASAVACWLGWRCHNRLHRSRPLGEQALQPDAPELAHNGKE